MQVLSLISYMHGTIEPLFHHDLLGTGRLLDLVERSVIGDGEVVLYCPFFLDTVSPIGSEPNSEPNRAQ